MHRALAASTDDPAFAIHSTKRVDVEAWTREVASELREMLGNLERADLTGDAAEAADAVLFDKEALFGKITAVSTMTPSGGQSRIHGDYHLGQVLVTDDDLMIIDFEGEPRRPLAERTAKTSPLRDVAGMLRSLDYAAAAAVSEVQGGEAASRIMRWRDETSARFLRAYGEHIAGCPTYPDDPLFANALLELFLIQKAAYEVGYELANRPSWVSIPLRGLIGLVGEHNRSPSVH
jgi:maltose alpha-D-glucosyltransferase/alpha-amylase